MRMSLSRFAGLGIALMAGVTLASCASSSAFFPATGPNTQVNGFPGGSARVHFIMGSPNVNLGVNNTDLYIDNVLAFSNFFYAGCAGPAAPNPCAVIGLAPIVPATSGALIIGPATPYIALPVGRHDFKLVQHGTLAPAFIDIVFTLAANTKYAFVASGDAGYSSTGWTVFTEPVYQTPTGIRAASAFNASPNARGAIDFWYSCGNPNGPCLSTGSTGTSIGLGVALGGSKTNVLLKASPTGTYCFGTYVAGTVTEIPFANAATGPPFATMPIASSENPESGSFCASNVSIGPGTDNNFYVVDSPSVAPRAPAHGPSTVDWIPDSNG